MRRLILLLTMASVMSGFAKQITDLSELSNTTVVTIERRPVEADSCGYLSYEPGDDETSVNYTLQVKAQSAVTDIDPLTDNQMWVIYHHQVDDAYYMYNVGAQRCVNVTSSNCQLLTDGSVINLQYFGDDRGWTLSSDTYALGLSKSCRSAVYFLKDASAANAGFFYTINDVENRQLTDSEMLIMQEVIDGTHRAAVEQYRAFAEMARKLNSDGLNNYCGGYNIDELYKLVTENDAAKVSLTDLERLKQEALKSSYPSPNAYYRIKNYERPVAGNLNNYMTLRPSGEQLFCQNTQVLGVSNSADNGENLRLFQFNSVEGLSYDRARIRVCSVDKGLQIGDKDFVITFLDNDEAWAFQLVRKAEDSRLFKLQYNGQNKRLTTNGVYGGQGIAINVNDETAMLWYIEKVESFEGPTLTNGSVAMILPCPVEIPSDCSAYYVSSIEGSSIKIKKIEDVIPAYTSFILQGPIGSTPTFKIVEEATTPIADNILTGTNYYKSNSDELLMLTKDEKGKDVFERRSDVTELSANTAYILASDLDSNITTFTVEEAEQSGADDIITNSDSSDVKYYDINGRRVINPVNGTIVIDSNGNKKVRK